MEKKDGRGPKKGRQITWNTHPKGVTKNKTFLGNKVSEEEYEELKKILSEGKKITGLNTISFFKKLFYDYARENKINFKK